MQHPFAMQRLTLILQQVVLFAFPLPFLLGFGMQHMSDWTGYLALVLAVILAALATWVGWLSFRDNR